MGNERQSSLLIFFITNFVAFYLKKCKYLIAGRDGDSF